MMRRPVRAAAPLTAVDIEALRGRAFWTPCELAAVLRVDVESLYRRLRQGDLEGAVRLGRTYRISSRPWLERMDATSQPAAAA
jgi:hypothetical protein